ncbi:MAG: hypothetical protein H7X91_04450 [Burkholderiales bacterium]|nr:hypothetical protein [Burkholderiales bacterium]
MRSWTLGDILLLAGRQSCVTWKGLFIDEDPTAFDEQDFKRQAVDIEDPIFSTMYLNGTVNDGSLVGGWTAPGPSSTNSVLLGPDIFSFFAKKATKSWRGRANVRGLRLAQKSFELDERPAQRDRFPAGYFLVPA